MVHGVAKSQTRLSDFTHSLTSLKFYKDAALIGFLIEMPVKIEF